MVTTDWGKVIENKIAEAKTRGSKKRGWIKLSKSWLTSSINYRMELSEQAVFSKLMLLADDCGAVPGLISDNDFRAMPHDYLAHLACCPIEVFEATLQKAKDDESIFENGHGIFMIHFDDYQFTEYDRQRPYREEARKKLNEEIKKQDTMSFEDFVKSLVSDYPTLNVDSELKKFKLWWGETGKELKRPKVAFRNWLDKALKIQSGEVSKSGTHQQATPRGLPGKYTKPEEL